MKRNVLNVLTAAVLLSIGSTALAASPYVGLNYTQYELKSNATSKTLNPTGATVRLGVDFTDFFAIEGRAGTGIEADKSTAADFELDRMYGGYLKLSVPIAAIRPYAIAGYTEVRGKATLGPLTGTSTTEDESYGVGVDLSLGVIGLNAEYMRYLDKDNEELNAISVGVRSSF